MYTHTLKIKMAEFRTPQLELRIVSLEFLYAFYKGHVQDTSNLINNFLTVRNWHVMLLWFFLNYAWFVKFLAPEIQ